MRGTVEPKEFTRFYDIQKPIYIYRLCIMTASLPWVAVKGAECVEQDDSDDDVRSISAAVKGFSSCLAGATTRVLEVEPCFLPIFPAPAWFNACFSANSAAWKNAFELAALMCSSVSSASLEDVRFFRSPTGELAASAGAGETVFR